MDELAAFSVVLKWPRRVKSAFPRSLRRPCLAKRAERSKERSLHRQGRAISARTTASSSAQAFFRCAFSKLRTCQPFAAAQQLISASFSRFSQLPTVSAEQMACLGETVAKLYGFGCFVCDKTHGQPAKVVLRGLAPNDLEGCQILPGSIQG